MKITSAVKTGIISIVALALLVWGINFLKGKDVFRKQRYFYAVYDRIDGLVKSNYITINGMKVGQVSDIRFIDYNSAKILVEMAIINPIPIPDNSVAMIFSSDLMGSKQIAIQLGTSSTTLESGDTMISSIEVTLMEEVNKQLLPFKKKAEDLMGSIDSAVTVLSAIFTEKTRENLEGSIESIRHSFANLESTTYSIDTLMTTQRVRLSNIIGNIESISRNIKDNNEEISNILTNFSMLSDTLAKADIAGTLLQTQLAIEHLEAALDKINKGEGSLGMLLNDDKLYLELHNSSRDLDLLLQDMRLNPGRYIHFSVFGKSSKKNSYAAPDTSQAGK